MVFHISRNNKKDLEMKHLQESLSSFLKYIQLELLPKAEEEVGILTKNQQQLISTLEMLQLECFIPNYRGWPGRPQKDRIEIGRAFVAKMIYQVPTTTELIDRLKSDPSLRRICGWETRKSLPSESKFSRVFAEFAESQLPQKIHESLIKETHQNRIVGHLCRDSTSINAREKPIKKPEAETPPPKKRGRPKKGEEKPKIPRVIEQQLDMSLDDMLKQLPTACDVGTKKNSKGYKTSWIGYKFHIDCVDGQIPVSCILTSASVHDSQVAIPLASISHKRVKSCYDLMDSAYDVKEIKQHSEKLGHVPIIDINPRRNKALKEALIAEKKCQQTINHLDPKQVRYRERSSIERVNGRLKDEFGGRYVRVRGHAKITCHLMFGILALTVDQLTRLAAN